MMLNVSAVSRSLVGDGVMLMSIGCRGRIPRGSIHSAGQSYQNVVGLHERTGCYHGGDISRGSWGQKQCS